MNADLIDRHAIQRLREICKLDRARAARLCGLTEAQIIDLESGGYSQFPSREMKVQAALKFGVALSGAQPNGMPVVNVFRSRAASEGLGNGRAVGGYSAACHELWCQRVQHFCQTLEFAFDPLKFAIDVGCINLVKFRLNAQSEIGDRQADYVQWLAQIVMLWCAILTSFHTCSPLLIARNLAFVRLIG